MARSGRGGARTGTPGSTYQNRTDLAVPKPPPIARFQGEEQGIQATQVRQQQQAPSSPPAAVAPPIAAGGGAPMIPPTFTPLGGPSTRPDEPVTAGLSTGPGPGPEILNQTPGTLAVTLQQAAQASGSVSLAALADRASQMGQ